MRALPDTNSGSVRRSAQHSVRPLFVDRGEQVGGGGDVREPVLLYGYAVNKFLRKNVTKEELQTLQTEMRERTRIQKIHREILVAIDTELRNLKTARRRMLATIEHENSRKKVFRG
jgi:hypothetical protein